MENKSDDTCLNGKDICDSEGEYSFYKCIKL